MATNNTLRSYSIIPCFIFVEVRGRVCMCDVVCEVVKFIPEGTSVGFRRIPDRSLNSWTGVLFVGKYQSVYLFYIYDTSTLFSELKTSDRLLI